MPKIILFQSDFRHYRVPALIEISKKYDLTLAFYGKTNTPDNFPIKTIKLTSKVLGPFRFIRNIRKVVSGFDVIITQPDMHVPSLCLLPFLLRNKIVISWSIGFRCSYDHPYSTNRKHVLADRVFGVILSKCDANIFYMEKSKEFWNRSSLDMNKVFIAPNTTAVDYVDNTDVSARTDFLFVGTLYRGKGFDVLLKSYNEFVQSRPFSESKLHIVGDGTERENIENYIKENKLEDKVLLHGAIYDESKLSKLFTKSILCISPNQAGLSAPKSMGYGTVFVTRHDAITGGEVYHITPNENGVFYEKDEDLLIIMQDADDNPNKYIEMGEKARDYYLNNATPLHMAQGVIDAVEYAIGPSNTTYKTDN